MKTSVSAVGSSLGSPSSDKTRLKRFLGFWIDVGYLGLIVVNLSLLGLFLAYCCVVGARWVTGFIADLN